jgi:twinkle protein
MFNNFEEFSNWLDISKNFDSHVIKDIYKFIEAFPMAETLDYIKASKKIASGTPVEECIIRYGKHIESLGEKDGDDFVEIVRMEDVIEEMVADMKSGAMKGSTTHIELIDQAWKWRENEFTLFTGNNQDGKSLFLRYLSLIKGIKDGWPTAAYAPEDWPAKTFFDELIFTASGYSTDKENLNFIGEENYRKVYKQIKKHFTFVGIRPPKNSLENILKAFIPLIEKNGVKICIVDPLVKITRPKEYVNNDAMWAAYVSAICTDFARRYNICLILVLHQLTPKIQENGRYAKPDKYTIKGGGNFSDSADNVLFMQRPMAPADNNDTIVRFGSLKIKKQRLVAIPQEVMFRFNRKTNRYVDEDSGLDLFDFDSELNIGRLQILNFKN